MRSLAILVVEDEVLIAMDVEMILQEAGHRVVGIARCAPDAVEIAERERPDLALMDLHLANDTRGEDAAREIRARFGIRSIFLSGTIDEARGALNALDPIAILSKPVQPQRLAQVVAKVA